MYIFFLANVQILLRAPHMSRGPLEFGRSVFGELDKSEISFPGSPQIPKESEGTAVLFDSGSPQIPLESEGTAVLPIRVFFEIFLPISDRIKKRGAPIGDRSPEGFFSRAIYGSGKKTRVSSTCIFFFSRTSKFPPGAPIVDRRPFSKFYLERGLRSRLSLILLRRIKEIQDRGPGGEFGRSASP